MGRLDKIGLEMTTLEQELGTYHKKDGGNSILVIWPCREKTCRFCSKESRSNTE